MTTETNKPGKNVTTGLAMVGGLGITLMVLALAVGVGNGAQANNEQVGLLLITGLGLSILAIGAWVGVVQPHKNFDDINIPAEVEPHDDH